MNQNQVSIIQNEPLDIMAFGNNIIDVISTKITNQVSEKIIIYLSEYLKSLESQNNQVYYTIQETCKIFNISRTTLYNWGKKGVLEADGWKGRPVYSKKLVDDFLLSKEKEDLFE